MKRDFPAYFGASHPLAEVAERHCDAPPNTLVGGVACGTCWELAIRDDERVAVEYGLPREVDPDPDYVDEIAVDLACSGERVELTPVEFRAAVMRLRARRMSPVQIARRLHSTYDRVKAVRDEPTFVGRLVAVAA